MPRRKLTDEQVSVIRKRVASGETLRRIAVDYGVTWNTIRNVVIADYRGYRRAA
jgi:predicted transcriptional regulator